MQRERTEPGGECDRSADKPANALPAVPGGAHGEIVAAPALQNARAGHSRGLRLATVFGGSGSRTVHDVQGSADSYRYVDR
jgi:hypothetical protein